MSSTTGVKETSQDTAEEPPGRRRALLIGIRDTEHLARNPRLAALYAPLECVDGDVRRIEEALRASQYEVSTLRPGHPDEERRTTTREVIGQTIEDFLHTCAPGDTALIYVSGHGVVIEGHDYLLPSNATHHPDGTLNSRMLIETSAPVLLYGLPQAVTVVVCLDMCRTDVPGTAPKLAKPLVGDEYENVIWLRAASRNQSAFADPERGSYFGLALATALSPSRPPRTLGEVYSSVQGRVAWLTERLADQPTVELLAPAGREPWARELPLCRGSQETLRWTDVVKNGALWKHTSGTEGARRRVQERLGELAAEVARSRVDKEAPVSTPWHDPDYPERVVHMLGRLVEEARLEPHELLSPAETAALLAAPLLHEGVVAITLSELERLRPDRLDQWDETRGEDPARDEDRKVCDDTADVCRAHSRVNLAVEALRRRRLTDAVTAADHWLRHRFIADWDRLWDRADGYPAVGALLHKVVKAVSAGAEGTAPRDSDVDQAVRRVLPHMTVEPGSSPRIDDSDSPAWTRTGRPVPGNLWREEELANLLWLAALLAADPRRMSSTLVDHLGAHRPLTPKAVVDALGGLGWDEMSRDGTKAFALRLACPHPALHSALEELAATADGSVRTRHRKWQEAGRPAPDLLRGLPRRVTTQFLNPVARTYTKPLERFRLAEDEIRPLLMGTQLYGDRMLAVRELYQNALDACRYRQLRVTYGRKRERYHGPGGEPEIHFLQAYDGDRLYIQCSDNGAGMSREKLTSMFARAGKRYEQDPDFVQERRNWRRADMDPTPFNSRFGIGVFSYFMLAEEVTVSTAAIDQHGNRDHRIHPLEATVQSGSGLLQILETHGGPAHGGTVVRLYLSAEDDKENPPSVVETLRRLLWVSDFRVTAEERRRDGKQIGWAEWNPGALQAAEDRARKWHRDPVPTGPSTGSWIVQGKGQLLLDGIVMEEAPDVHGYVFNLRARHRPVPSVNRNSLLEYDAKGVKEELLRAVPHAAGTLKEVSMRWLWRLAEEEPRLTVQILDHLPHDATGFLTANSREHTLSTAHLPLRRTGVLLADSDQLRSGHSTAPWLTGGSAEGVVLQRWRRTMLGIASRTVQSFAPVGYPEATGVDALLFSSDSHEGGWSAALRAAAMAEIPLAESVRALRRYAITGARVPVVENIAELRKIGTPNRTMLDLHRAYGQAAVTSTDVPRPASHAPLLTVAARHDVAPSRLLPDLRALISLGVTIPDIEGLASGNLSGKPLSSEAALLATRDGDMREWHGGEVHPVDLLMRTPLPSQRRQLFERLDALAPFGFSRSEAVSEETFDHPPLDFFEQRLLSTDLDGRFPWLPSGRLTMRQVIQRAATVERPLGEVAHVIDGLAPVTGVTAPEIPVSCLAWIPAPWVVSGGDVTSLSWQLLYDASDRAAPPEEFRAELQFLEACGCLSVPVDLLEEQYRSLSPHLRKLLTFALAPWSEDAYGRELEEGAVGVPLLLHFAADLKITLAEAVDLLAQADIRLPLLLPENLPGQAAVLMHRRTEVARLTRSAEDTGIVFKSRLTPQDILFVAVGRLSTLGEAATILDAYRCLGAPALPGSGVVTGALAALEPTDFDLAAFDDGLLGPGVLGPLELVLVAGRFGWTLGETYDRYAPFAELGLDVTTPEPVRAEREIVPGWPDVIVLTAQLTGLSPAIAGTVSAEHVVLCAEETERSEEDVLDLLRPYARLFELDLPSSGGTRP
ncbi:caspase family protein [Streptomyces sp. WAC01280]|uniref:HD domain-containing protein n=1 Tax=Streptomyces sp. WAC01280 TaxID=2487424 RepID=UPI000F7AF47F|nr:caspase family protein [Streptomyces sp. WAC01280]RSS51996.1 ATP-binding protein [Streptomyces sp. WAC01280]